MIATPETQDYNLWVAEKFTEENRTKEARAILLNLLAHSTKEDHNRAILASILANIYKKEGCRDCWARFYCSGGCNANNYEYCGDILKPNPLSCEIEKKRVECAIMIKAAMAE